MKLECRNCGNVFDILSDGVSPVSPFCQVCGHSSFHAKEPFVVRCATHKCDFAKFIEVGSYYDAAIHRHVGVVGFCTFKPVPAAIKSDSPPVDEGQEGFGQTTGAEDIVAKDPFPPTDGVVVTSPKEDPPKKKEKKKRSKLIV